MAVFKIAEPAQNVYDEGYIAEKINYILQPEKIRSGYWGGFGFLKCSVTEVIDQFYIVKNIYHKSAYIPLRHYIISFDSFLEKLTPYQASLIAERVCYDLASEGYQVIYAIHEDTYNLHIHILLNTINLFSGYLFNQDKNAFSYIVSSIKVAFAHVGKKFHIPNLKLNINSKYV